MTIPKLVGTGLIQTSNFNTTLGFKHACNKHRVSKQDENAAKEVSKKIIGELWSKRLDDDLAKLISENFIELF